MVQLVLLTEVVGALPALRIPSFSAREHQPVQGREGLNRS